MKHKIIIMAMALAAVCPRASAQWVVTDPTNLVQGIVNSVNEIVQTSTTAQNIIGNFQETIKIYEQGKRYYDALRSVTNLVRDARKVNECRLMVGEITDIFVNSYQKMLADENFTVPELAAISVGYTKLLQQGANELRDLQDIVNPSDMSLSDKDRLDVIDRVHASLTRLRNLTAYYTRKNIAVSVMRAMEADNAERVLQLYGPDDQKYW